GQAFRARFATGCSIRSSPPSRMEPGSVSRSCTARSKRTAATSSSTARAPARSSPLYCLGAGSRHRRRPPRRNQPLHRSWNPPRKEQSVPELAPSKPSVLVVDDETGILDSLSILLRNEGFAPQIAHGGKAGLERMEEMNPDIVLTDIRMPNVN